MNEEMDKELTCENCGKSNRIVKDFFEERKIIYLLSIPHESWCPCHPFLRFLSSIDASLDRLVNKIKM